MDKFLKNNTFLRVLALLLSCILWVSVSMQNDAAGGAGAGAAMSEKFPRPVNVQVDANLVVSGIDASTAVVVVSGNGLNSVTLPAQMLGVTVNADARGLGPGRHVVRLTATNMPAVSYTIEPSTVTVNIDQKQTAARDVKVTVQGTPASGYDVGDVVTDLQTVKVSGLQSEVNVVDHVEAALSIQGAKQTVTRAVNLRPVDKAGNAVTGVDVTPANLTVTVPVQSPRISAEVVPQVVGSPQSGYAVADVALNPTMVNVSGSPSVTAGLQSVTVPVDVTGFNATKTIRVALPLRQGITQISPNTISVTVKIEPSASKTFDGVPIAVRNAPSNERISITGEQTVSLVVTGPRSMVDALQPSSVSVYIDGARLKDGDTTAPLNVLVPNWLQVTQMSAHTVDVSVQPNGH